MSWRDICPMDEKVSFIAAVKEKRHSISVLCRKFSISRKTGYKWLKRYAEEGAKGLYAQTKARKTQSHQTTEKQQRLILKAKTRFKDWGPKKIKAWLEVEYSQQEWPAASTIGDILKKHGMVEPRSFRRRVPPQSEPFGDCEKPNDVWSADFKGQFRTGDKKYCYPLTVTDNHSRFILACDGYLRPTLQNVQKSMLKAFNEHGLPKAIRTDNGTPFASTGAGGLSRLSIWWLKLGIYPQRIEIGHPEQNGRHERMHRTLKQATALPSKRNINSQNRAFKKFIDEFNFIRPHEALENKRPCQVYQSSDRKYPSKFSEMNYPGDRLVRTVRSNGQIKLNGKLIFVSEILYGESLGIIEVEDGIWDVQYSVLGLGVIDERKEKLIHYDKFYD